MAIVIAGAGSLGRVMHDFLIAEQEIVGFVDDAPELEGTNVCGLPVMRLDQIGRLGEPTPEAVVAALDPAARERLAQRLLALGIPLARCFSETAFVSPSAQIGIGCNLLPYSFVMNNARVGDFVHLHFNSVIGHDVVVGDYSSFGPQCIIGGNVRIGRKVTLGMGVRVLPNVVIHEAATLGAAAVVTRDVPQGAVVYGNPARQVR